MDADNFKFRSNYRKVILITHPCHALSIAILVSILIEKFISSVRHTFYESLYFVYVSNVHLIFK